MDSTDASESIKERIKTLFRLWLRNKISNNVDSIKDEDFEEMWECKPTFAGEHFYDANSLLFKFVSCPEHISSNALVDRKCIKMRENLYYLYLYIQSFAEKSMSEISFEVDDLLSKIVIVKQIEDDIEEMDESEEEIITNEPRHRVHTRDLLESQFDEDDEDIVFDGWTWITIIKSNMLREIVASTDVYKGLVLMFSKICGVSNNYTLNIVVNCLKELRRIYMKALSSISPMTYDLIKKIEILSIFTGRHTKEIKSSLVNEEIVELGKRITSMRVSDEIEINSNSKFDGVFSSWLIVEHLKLNSRIPTALKRLFETIKNEQHADDYRDNTNEMSTEAIIFLDNPGMYDFIKGLYNSQLLIEQLFTMNISYEKIDELIWNKRKIFEELILKNLAKLCISNKSISFIIFRDALWSILNRSQSLWWILLLSEIAKYGEYTAYHNEEIEKDLILKRLRDQWNERCLQEISDPSVWGIWFRIITNTTGAKYIELRRYEHNLLNRLKRHEKKFFDFGNNDKPWVKYKYSLKKNKGMSVNEKNKTNNDNIIGFYACKFCLNSLRSNKGNPHPNSRQRADKYDRQAIIDIEYDFSATPEWIERVSWNIRDYIQFGIIYSHTTYWGTLKTLTMFGDSRQRLNNGQFDFIKIHKKLEVITYNQSVLIENAIRWLRRNNHLSEVFTTIYESEEIKKAAIVIEGNNLL